MITESRLLHLIKQWESLILLKDNRGVYYCGETILLYKFGAGDSPKTAYCAMEHNNREWNRRMKGSK